MPKTTQENWSRYFFSVAAIELRGGLIPCRILVNDTPQTPSSKAADMTEHNRAFPSFGNEAHETDNRRPSFLIPLGLQFASSAIGLTWGYLASQPANLVDSSFYIIGPWWIEICKPIVYLLFIATLIRLKIAFNARDRWSISRLGMSCAASVLAAITVIMDVTFTGDVASAIIHGTVLYFSMVVLMYILIDYTMFVESVGMFMISTCLISSMVYNPGSGYGKVGLSTVTVVDKTPEGQTWFLVSHRVDPRWP